MESIPNISLLELENSVNKVFECQQKQVALELQNSTMQTEWLLMQHMLKAFQLIDRGTD